MNFRRRAFATPLFLSALFSVAFAKLPEARPSALGMDSARLDRIDEIVQRAIEEKRIPGAVVLVGRDGKVAFARAYGIRAWEPTIAAMTRDTVFDMASLTKPLATASSLLVLLEQGKLRLDAPVKSYFPEFDRAGKGSVTIEQLLRHRSGLIADNPLSDYADGPKKAWERICDLKPVAPPNERFIYSDVNYIVLGKLIEKVSGKRLDEFAEQEIFRPLGMRNTGFKPAGNLDRIAPTEKEGDHWLRGTVHDPRARALGGVAGHAGLFSTADDVALFADMILREGKGPDGTRILAPLTVRAMIDPGSTPAGQKRGLGWDVSSAFSHPRGALFGPRSFGHTGFTGTSLWIDPETKTFVAILASRLYPDGRGNANALRSEIATCVAASLVELPSKVEPPSESVAHRSIHPVKCGIDVLIDRDFDVLQGKRVALITNQTGRTRDGRATIDVLFHAPGVKLVKLFSPEHGIRGVADARVEDEKDERTGLPILSLYGKTNQPSRESLADIDILTYDIQDIGARFYTYITTLGLALEAAGDRKIPFLVLDRPNPIGGEAVSGPVRDDDFASFIAYHALPSRHGMTVGELAKLYRSERKIEADLIVVPCEGWRRADLFDRTGLVWVDPSPNIRSLTEAFLYPGVCWFEATEMAHGRGTDTPFEKIGAPWIEPSRFALELNRLRLPGVRFVPIRFRPTARQHAGRECGGVHILLKDWSAADPIDIALGLAVTLQKMYPGRWGDEGFLKLVADRATRRAILEGKSIPEIKSLWSGELESFREVRRKYLIY